MVAKWVFEYDNGGSWVAFAAKLQSTDESLNDHEEAQIALPNTSANRTLVGSSRTVRIKYDTHVVFTGQLAALDYGATRLKCILYNAVYEAMKAKTITADYTSGEQADTIFGAICTAAGVTAGTCPTTSIAVRFDEASCYDAALFLCDCLNLDHSATGNTFNIAARGSAKSVTHFKIKSRGVDRSKLRDKVRVKGVDSSGLEIVGEAGSGTNVAVFREKKASDKATLDTLAAKKLAELNTVSKGAPVDIPISEGYDLYPGDTLAVANALYDLSGTYKIMRISKSPSRVAVQLDRAKSTLEEKLLDVKKYQDLGIYPNQPSQITPWALSVQGLFALYHLNLVSDDEPDLVLDTSGSYPANDGTITTGYWVDGVIPGTKVLSFNADGFVDCNNGFDPGGLDHFAVGLWFSPETNYADGNYLIKKVDQFYLQHYSTDNKLRFAVKIGSSWHTVTSEANVSPLWSRNFAMGIYDGTHLLLYLNGVLVAQEDQTGNVDASTNNTFLAVDFDGVISEAMLWTRALTAQEVQELYFFPLTRSVKRTPIIEGAWLMQGTEEKTHNLVSEGYIVNSCILSGMIPVSSPTGTMNSYEAGYMCLALLHVGGYTALVEDVLDLMASLQNGDGSWYQQYNPYAPFDRVETISPGGVDGDLKVDSGAALMGWAMSEYDRLTSGTRYLSNVRVAMGFLRDLQYAHLVEYSSNLIANLVYLGDVDKVALLADCAECLLSMKAAMDAYGDTVQTTGSYSVKTMANDLYYSIAAVGWRGDLVHYYDTSFPYETNTGIPFNFKEKISYTQALCSWANYAFANSGYRTTSDYSAQCINCLDYINTLTRGSWGGQYFCPYYGGEGESKDEFVGYSSLMSIACQVVDSTRYAALITGTKSFIQWLALSDGRTYDCVSQRGRLWASKLEPFADIPIEGEFLVLGNSLAVLAGADHA